MIQVTWEILWKKVFSVMLTNILGNQPPFSNIYLLQWGNQLGCHLPFVLQANSDMLVKIHMDAMFFSFWWIIHEPMTCRKLFVSSLLVPPCSRPPPCKIIVAYSTSNHRLVIELDWWLTNPISRHKILYQFYCKNASENDTLLVNVPPSTLLEIGFHPYVKM